MASDELLIGLRADPYAAHKLLFGHRHDRKSPDAHRAVIEAWHSDIPRLLVMAFRGFAKTTIGEEAAIIAALYRTKRNILILSESETRACDRLRAIKHELEYNELIIGAFGPQVGPTWGEGRIVTTSGVCIQAYGRNQSLRGVKHLQWRPDLAILDDVEDETSVNTREAREGVVRWWTSVVRPALSEDGVVRMLATPLRDGREDDEKSLPLRLRASPEWTTLKFPIRFRDENTGEWRATWPEKFPLEWVEKTEKELSHLGRHADFSREYMCEAVSDESRIFPSTIIPPFSQPRPFGWRSAIAAIDPARTKNNRSDFTGWAVWTWEANKLIVWESGAEKISPNEIIDLAFRLSKKWNCQCVAIEQDGLDDFLIQPLRMAAVERGPIPFTPVRAPRGKADFIRQLQPFFMAGEVELVGDHKALRDQLLSFPTGHDDAPNALAYALKLRGAPRFPDFGPDNVTVDPSFEGQRFTLAVAAKNGWTVAVLLATKGERVTVVDDWVVNDAPLNCLSDVAREAALDCEDGSFRVVAAPEYHDRYDITALRGAVRRIPMTLHRSGDPLDGRAELLRLIAAEKGHRPLFRVCDTAKWSLRAFAGGAETVETSFEPLDLLLSAVESFCASVKPSIDRDDDVTYAFTSEGRRYITSNPNVRRY